MCESLLQRIGTGATWTADWEKAATRARAHACLHGIQSHELMPRLVGGLVGQLWTVVQGKRSRLKSCVAGSYPGLCLGPASLSELAQWFLCCAT